MGGRIICNRGLLLSTFRFLNGRYGLLGEALLDLSAVLEVVEVEEVEVEEVVEVAEVAEVVEVVEVVEAVDVGAVAVS